MLKVKTHIYKSLISGIGLFANEFIPKGTIIWENSPGLDIVFSEKKYLKLTGLDKEFVKKYSFRYADKYYLCIDDSRFFNHSENPNCMDSEPIGNEIGKTIALRDINNGEELTSNYRFFGFEGNKKDLEHNMDLS